MKKINNRLISNGYNINIQFENYSQEIEKQIEGK